MYKHRMKALSEIAGLQRAKFSLAALQFSLNLFTQTLQRRKLLRILLCGFRKRRRAKYNSFSRVCQMVTTSYFLAQELRAS